MHHRYPRYPVSCEIDGQTCRGHYWIAGMILVVSSAWGSASRQLANRQPEELAQTLLSNLVANSQGADSGSRRPAGADSAA